MDGKVGVKAALKTEDRGIDRNRGGKAYGGNPGGGNQNNPNKRRAGGGSYDDRDNRPMRPRGGPSGGSYDRQQQQSLGSGGGDRRALYHPGQLAMDVESVQSKREWSAALAMAGGPTYDIPTREKTEEEQKFTGRCRLFVANLPPSINEITLKDLFEQFGEVSEVFLGKQNAFAFVKMDTRKHAEDARSALDNKIYDGRSLRVRLAAHAAAVKVKNLSPMVTNELLEFAFSFFGEVERAVVIADDRGRSIGEGFVEFARKSAATNCLKRCAQECFLLTANPSPVIVEPFEQRDEDEGFTERHVMKHTPEFRMERELGPRFAEPGSFEYDFGQRWKQLYELEKEKRERLEVEVREARQALIEQMEFARVEHQTKALKEKLRMMEEQTGKFDVIRNNRLEIERRREEERQREELLFRQREEEILRRSSQGVSGVAGGEQFSALRDQETDLRMQANALQDMLDRQETAIRQIRPPPGPNPYGAGVGALDPAGIPYGNDPYAGHPHAAYHPGTPELNPQLNPDAFRSPNTRQPVIPRNGAGFYNY